MPSLAAVRFLIVDDNAPMRLIVRTILRGFGVKHVTEVTNAADAMATLSHEQVDILIVDYNMPGDDGVSFVSALRLGLPMPISMTPVIMLTAHTERSRVVAAREAGVTEFCAKPVTPSNLMAKIVTIIDRPRPFVSASAYFGPCRRRRIEVNGVVLERRAPKEA